MAEKKPKDITDFTKNHRRRMRAKLRDNGGESLSHKELLEMLLFYNFRRGDIKPVVKSLFARFETLDHILHAPAYDLANLVPGRINFRIGGLITAGFGFIIGGLWVSFITQMGLFPFVNTLGAILAPVFGIMIADYYILKKQQLNVDALFDDSPEGEYHYQGGFNRKAILAWILSGYIAVGSIWPGILVFGLDSFFTNLGGGGGYAWIIGASLGALIHLGISRK